MSQTSIMLQLYACGQKFIEIFTLNVTENLKNAVPERVKENQITSIYKHFLCQVTCCFYQNDQTLQVSFIVV